MNTGDFFCKTILFIVIEKARHQYDERSGYQTTLSYFSYDYTRRNITSQHNYKYNRGSGIQNNNYSLSTFQHKHHHLNSDHTSSNISNNQSVRFSINTKTQSITSSQKLK